MSKTTNDSEVESGLVGGSKSAAEHHDGGHHIQITNIKFNGSNYLRWSQSVRAYLKGRRKLGYITGAKKEPEEDDAAYEAWDSDNGTIITWLVNSMTEEIGAQYPGYQSAKEVWTMLPLSSLMKTTNHSTMSSLFSLPE